jgi:hypothetical protein
MDRETIWNESLSPAVSGAPVSAYARTQPAGPVCDWCSRPFTPRRTGGRPQRFCSERCRRASEKAMREWAQQELAAGRVTIAEIKRERWSELAPTNPCPGATCPSGEPRALS